MSSFPCSAWECIEWRSASRDAGASKYGFPRRAWEPDQALPTTSMEGGSANGLPGAIFAICVGSAEGGYRRQVRWVSYLFPVA